MKIIKYSRGSFYRLLRHPWNIEYPSIILFQYHINIFYHRIQSNKNPTSLSTKNRIGIESINNHKCSCLYLAIVRKTIIWNVTSVPLTWSSIHRKLKLYMDSLSWRIAIVKELSDKRSKERKREREKTRTEEEDPIWFVNGSI